MGSWKDRKIGRSSLEMIETGLYSMLRACFSKESCVCQSWEIQQIVNPEEVFHFQTPARLIQDETDESEPPF
jgi:hypothetical protein